VLLALVEGTPRFARTRHIGGCFAWRQG
jgi:hypothetical protein